MSAVDLNISFRENLINFHGLLTVDAQIYQKHIEKVYLSDFFLQFQLCSHFFFLSLHQSLQFATCL